MYIFIVTIEKRKINKYKHAFHANEFPALYLIFILKYISELLSRYQFYITIYYFIYPESKILQCNNGKIA